MPSLLHHTDDGEIWHGGVNQIGATCHRVGQKISSALSFPHFLSNHNTVTCTAMLSVMICLSGVGLPILSGKESTK